MQIKKLIDYHRGKLVPQLLIEICVGVFTAIEPANCQHVMELSIERTVVVYLNAVTENHSWGLCSIACMYWSTGVCFTIAVVS